MRVQIGVRAPTAAVARRARSNPDGGSWRAEAMTDEAPGTDRGRGPLLGLARAGRGGVDDSGRARRPCLRASRRPCRAPRDAHRGDRRQHSSRRPGYRRSARRSRPPAPRHRAALRLERGHPALHRGDQPRRRRLAQSAVAVARASARPRLDRLPPAGRAALRWSLVRARRDRLLGVRRRPGLHPTGRGSPPSPSPDRAGRRRATRSAGVAESWPSPGGCSISPTTTASPVSSPDGRSSSASTSSGWWRYATGTVCACWSSTSTGSSGPTTSTGTRSGTRSSSEWRACSAPPDGSWTLRPGSAATSSPCCCLAPTSQATRRVGDRLVAAVGSADLPIPVTVSVGLSALTDGQTPDELLAAADASLYEAKAQGRNRVGQAIGQRS